MFLCGRKGGRRGWGSGGTKEEEERRGNGGGRRREVAAAAYLGSNYSDEAVAASYVRRGLVFVSPFFIIYNAGLDRTPPLLLFFIYFNRTALNGGGLCIDPCLDLYVSYHFGGTTVLAL